MAKAGRKTFTAERYASRPKPRHDHGNGHAEGSHGIDTVAILDAIEALRREVAELKATGAGATAMSDGDSEVRIEIAQMVRSIGRAKAELAAIKHPMADADDDRIRLASSELDEIVVATETATEDILRSAEHIGELLDEILARHPTDERLYALTEEAGQELVNIMEACSFQDITGQRVNKVVKTIRFIQDRILAMIGIWGAEAFADLPLKHQEERAEEALLNGPALGNEGLSQSDIDALFD